MCLFCSLNVSLGFPDGGWNWLRQGTKTPCQEEDASVGEPLLPGMPFLPGKVPFCAIMWLAYELLRCRAHPQPLSPAEKSPAHRQETLGGRAIQCLVTLLSITCGVGRLQDQPEPTGSARWYRAQELLD